MGGLEGRCKDGGFCSEWNSETLEQFEQRSDKIGLIFYFFLCMELIGVSPVNKIIQVLVEQFYNTPSVHCIAFTAPSHVSFLHHLSPLPLSGTSPCRLPPLPSLTVTTLCVHKCFFFFFAQSLHTPHSDPQQPSACLHSILKTNNRTF